MDAVLNRLKDQLKTAHLAHDYSKAISICEKLIEVDTPNIRKWSETIQQFRTLEKEKSQMMARLKSLADKIEAAVWEEDWEKVIALCKQYLEIENDKKIRLKLEQAGAKLEIIKRRQEFQQGVDSVTALIVDKKWESADQLCRELQKTYPEEVDVLRELRKIIFEGEEDSERNIQGKEKFRKTTPIGFKKNEDDDFFSDDGVSKQTRPVRPAKQKKESEQQDDFDFPVPKKEENDDFLNKTDLNATGSKRPLTNDDFDF